MNVKKHLTSYREIKLFAIIVLSFILVTACNGSEIQRSNISAEHAEMVTNCRVVEHSLGKTCIPITPQRIIAVETVFLDALFALGIKESIVGTICYPILHASGSCFPFGVPSDQLESVEKIGSYPPSLEKILFLKPDFILGLDWMKSTYKQLSDIAPTVLLRWGDDWNSSFKTYLRGIAQIVDREEVAEEILMQYQNRVAEVKKQLGNRLKNIEISAIIYGHGGRREFLAPPRYAIWFQILDDLGIKIKPIFSTQGNWSSYFSTELISDYDSDVLFILNSFSQSGAFLLENPLLASLNAVKNKRTYVMDGQDVFDVYGPSGVNKLLDLLAEKLLKVAQTL